MTNNCISSVNSSIVPYMSLALPSKWLYLLWWQKIHLGWRWRQYPAHSGKQDGAVLLVIMWTFYVFILGGESINQVLTFTMLCLQLYSDIWAWWHIDIVYWYEVELESIFICAQDYSDYSDVRHGNEWICNMV